MTCSPILRIAAFGTLCLPAAAVPAAPYLQDTFAGDKVDYRTNTTRATGLDVPPDLTQLSKDSRYQQPNGTISASTFQAAASGTPAATDAATGTIATVATGTGAKVIPTVALPAAGAFKIERLGQRALAQHDALARRRLSAGPCVLEGQRLQPGPGPLPRPA